MNIVLCGFMGSGKTTVGKEFAKMTGRKFVDTDEMIENEQGVSISEIFETNGEEYFRQLEFEMCKRVAKMNSAVVSTGGGAMTYQRNVDAIKENSKVVFLDASFDVVCQRVGNGETRPLFKDKDKAKKLYEERKAKYKNVADYVVNADLSAHIVASNIDEIFK